MMTIEMTENETSLFVRFQERHTLVDAVLAAIPQGFNNGSITLHFDKDGVVRKIDRQQTIYKT